MASKTEIFRGEQVLAALNELEGEANTEAIAERSDLGHVGTLVTCGQLSASGLIHKCSRGNKRGNPRWRLPVVGEEGYER